MKQFKDLEFNYNPQNGGVTARLGLDNGYVVSVVSNKGKRSTYGGFYGDVDEGTYEIAIFDKEGEFFRLHEWDDVLGWQTPEEIDALMIKAQSKGFEEECAKNNIEQATVVETDVDVDDDVPF